MVTDTHHKHTPHLSQAHQHTYTHSTGYVVQIERTLYSKQATERSSTFMRMLNLEKGNYGHNIR